MERGSKLLTGSEKQRLDKMFTKVIVQAYMQVQQVPNDTDLLMWWKQHCVGLVQTDLRGSLLDTTMIDLMWGKLGHAIDKELSSTIKKILIDKLSIRSFCY